MATPQPCRRFPPISCHRRQIKSPGFTLIELVLMIIIVGILSVTVLPKLTDFSLFSGREFFDKTQAALRYAQKSAIAQRRWVMVSDQTAGLRLTFCNPTASDGCVPDLTACTTPLIDPGTGRAFSLVAPSGTSFSHDASYTGSFLFDCSGRPSAGPILYTVNQDASMRFTVEAETGYVHP